MENSISLPFPQDELDFFSKYMKKNGGIDLVRNFGLSHIEEVAKYSKMMDPWTAATVLFVGTDKDYLDAFHSWKPGKSPMIHIVVYVKDKSISRSTSKR